MPAVRMLDRIERDIPRVLDTLVPEGDDFEWAVSLTPVVSECEQHAEEMELALVFYARLDCPESGVVSQLHLIMSLDQCEPGTLEEMLTDIWERLTLHRMENAMQVQHPGS